MPRSCSITKPWLSYFRLGAENSIVSSPDTDDLTAPQTRFDFAIGELPPQLFQGAYLEVEEERFNSNEMRRLYDSAEFPLARVLRRSARGLIAAVLADFERLSGEL
jgi:hypothetical protein